MKTSQLPTGMWKRGDKYYARFRANGNLVRKALSSDYRVACEKLCQLQRDEIRKEILSDDFKPIGRPKRRRSVRPDRIPEVQSGSFSFSFPEAVGPGLYFLLDDREIVYVGKTEEWVVCRVSQHVRDKKFNRVVYFCDASCGSESLMFAESWLICLLKPKYNKTSLKADWGLIGASRCGSILGIKGLGDMEYSQASDAISSKVLGQST